MAKLNALTALIVTLLSLVSPAHAQRSGAAAPDPYMLSEYTLVQSPVLWQSNHGYTDTNAKTYRFNALNTGVKNLVLIVAGQSNVAAEAPTAYTVTNSTAVDNFNIYDGGMYAYTDPPLGSTWAYLAFSGSGSTCATLASCGSVGGRVADIFINNAIFSRVIVVPVAVGGSNIAQWDTNGPLFNRICVAMLRLASRGITPQTNVTFAILWGQGESDHGTSSAAYQAALNRIQAQAVACGFSGRFFVNIQTWASGTVDATVQGAQSGIVDNLKFWAGANADSLNATNRQADNIHFNDTGVSSLATLTYNAMHASGPPL